MTTNAVNHPPKAVLFLKDEKDRALLQDGTVLYGAISPSGDSVFMTPYRPPSSATAAVAVVGESTTHQGKNAPPLMVRVKGESMTAAGPVAGRCGRIPVRLAHMADIYTRTPFAAAEMNALWASRVIVFGCGTGGSKIALELARAGVGHITLCDPEPLEYANVSRHEGDLLDVGKPKPLVAAERVYWINPAIQVETYAEDIFERPWDEVAKVFACDLVIAATDRTAIQFLINEVTHKLKVPCVFGGCYEEALGGEVFYTLPDEIMPCLACLRAGLKQPIRNPKIDYSRARAPNDYKGQPGLHAAVDFVTCVEIQVCLAILLRRIETSPLRALLDSRSNFILVGGALSAGFYRFRKPFDIFFQPLSGPRKNCPVCGNGLRSFMTESGPGEPSDNRQMKYLQKGEPKCQR
jgi:molybdopterin/thiamine biosynthesis adenylyltransferase